MDGVTVLLLCVAAYIAVRVLVRLMLARRNALWAQLQEQAAAERRKQRRQTRDEAEATAARGV